MHRQNPRCENRQSPRLVLLGHRTTMVHTLQIPSGILHSPTCINAAEPRHECAQSRAEEQRDTRRLPVCDSDSAGHSTDSSGTTALWWGVDSGSGGFSTDVSVLPAPALPP